MCDIPWGGRGSKAYSLALLPMGGARVKGCNNRYGNGAKDGQREEAGKQERRYVGGWVTG